ncbi:MAG: hypothetical protein KBC84_07915 [Proteobacteria bacterium]|nr:hypothetical protein [Pseudomonadota bacterium]
MTTTTATTARPSLETSKAVILPPPTENKEIPIALKDEKKERAEATVKAMIRPLEDTLNKNDVQTARSVFSALRETMFRFDERNQDENLLRTTLARSLEDIRLNSFTDSNRPIAIKGASDEFDSLKVDLMLFADREHKFTAMTQNEVRTAVNEVLKDKNIDPEKTLAAFRALSIAGVRGHEMSRTAEVFIEFEKQKIRNYDTSNRAGIKRSVDNIDIALDFLRDNGDTLDKFMKHVNLIEFAVDNKEKFTGYFFHLIDPLKYCADAYGKQDGNSRLLQDYDRDFDRSLIKRGIEKLTACSDKMSAEDGRFLRQRVDRIKEAAYIK